MQLASLKGLMESQLMVQDGQEELDKELNLSPEEIFGLLDINHDGQLQLHEVCVILWVMDINWSVYHAVVGVFGSELVKQTSLPQILTHSRVRDGIWLTPETLREIYAGLQADGDGNGRK